LVVVSGSDGQRLLVEVPDLSSSTVWNLDDHVSVIDQVKVSVIWEFGDNIEVSLNIETESLIELSLSWFALPFIDVNNVPLLVNFIALFIHTNVSVLLINLSLNFENLASLIDN